ncbi:MAG: hypothetical protein WA865_03105 [Spirulinaceae cyanobacterium]
MGVDNSPQNPSLESIIDQAKGELLSPHQFYYLCQKQIEAKQKLYFVSPSSRLLKLNSGISEEGFLLFCDYLANYLRSPDFNKKRLIFYLQKVKVRIKGRKIWVTRVIEDNFNSSQNLSFSLKVAVEIAGAGMVGRVAHVRINDSQEIAFKAFFDPDFIWHHGPWGEIPTGIYLTSNQVTKDVPEFRFAGQTWAVWEWITNQTSPQERKGITYEEFAQKQGLTNLNPLNRSNYNLHNIRLDLGGIQKKTWSRYWQNLFQGTKFYLRKGKREGLSSLTIYFHPLHFRYLFWRLIREICPNYILK